LRSVCFAALAIFLSGSVAHAESIAAMEARGWKLTFHDEFAGSGLDTGKWNRHYRHPRIYNHELQAYRPDAFSVADGVLQIAARRQRGTQNHITQEYVSGAMTTFGRFSQEFGYFEIRCRIPKGRGFWPAFWLMPNKKWPPEIDVFENIGHEPSKLYFTHHWSDGQGRTRSDEHSYQGPDFSQDFHTIAIDWNAGGIVWYVDGVERARSSEQTPRGKFYVLVNLAVGGDWPGPPDRETRFPGIFEVDYVRVYKKR